MSHIVIVQTQIKDLGALQATCRKLGLEQPVHGTHKLYGSQSVTGYAVKFPGWHYPAVFDIEKGECRSDTYGGSWGDISELHRLTRTYTAEKLKMEYRRKGYSVAEQSLENNKNRLTVTQLA